MSPARRPVSLVLFALAVLAGPLAAQAGVVKRNVNLRTGPATTFTIVRLLVPGDEFTLREADAEAGYFRVFTAAGDSGWVWSRNVRILEAPPAALPGPPEVFFGCGMEGNAQSERRRALNRQKNRNRAPTASDLDPTLTLAAMLVPGDDRARWDPARGGTLVGFVVAVKPGSSETVNCGASGTANTDAHIELTLSATDTAKTRRVVVEVTPRWRAFMAEQGVNWATATLRTELRGGCARFTGWLFFDDEHDDEAENTAPQSENKWRATAWELHPVTSIQAVPCPN